mmetsp:Transcript_51796/g.150410  ORF Transcript_51796/g.150410 Transcript_51796/m.150410 type:complete len:212 (+) Transcript_51796:3410-4045(+)
MERSHKYGALQTCKQTCSHRAALGACGIAFARSTSSSVGRSIPPASAVKNSHGGYTRNLALRAGPAGKHGFLPTRLASRALRSTFPVTASRGRPPVSMCNVAPRGSAARAEASTEAAAPAPRLGKARKACEDGPPTVPFGTAVMSTGAGNKVTSASAQLSATTSRSRLSAADRSTNCPATLTSESLRPRNSSCKEPPGPPSVSRTRSRVRK